MGNQKPSSQMEASSSNHTPSSSVESQSSSPSPAGYFQGIFKRISYPPPVQDSFTVDADHIDLGRRANYDWAGAMHHRLHLSPIVRIHQSRATLLASLAVGSYIGYFIRMGLLQAAAEFQMSTPPHKDIPYSFELAPPLLIVQMLGCFFIGLVGALKNIFFLRWFYLYCCLTIGLCGSLTTFSSWQLEAYRLLVQPPSALSLKNVIWIILYDILTLSASFSGWSYGKHIGNQLYEKYFPKLLSVQNKIQYQFIDQGNTVTSTNIIWWVIAIVPFAVFAGLASTSLGSYYIAGAVLSPIGTWLRWALGFLNSKSKSIPLGTLAANLLGTWLIGMLYLLETGYVDSSAIDCLWLKAIEAGFCGCLTTVSTFVVELADLPGSRKYMYLIISVVVGQCLLFINVAIVSWANNFSSKPPWPSCSY